VFGGVFDTTNLVFIAIEENYLVIYRFNVINGQYIYEELTRFDIYPNELASDFVLVNDSYRFSFARWRRPFLHKIDVGGTRTDLRFISSEINEHLLRQTYDHQKQYVGIYHKYSITYYGITEDEINARHRIRDILIMNIEDAGALFITNELGIDLFSTWQLILDENSQTIFFDHHPGDGSVSFGAYFLNGAIHFWFINRWEVNRDVSNDWEINEWAYNFQVIYKRNN